MPAQQLPYRLSVAFYSFNGAYNDHSIVQDLQCTLHLRREIDMTGSVQQKVT
ncbi:hypothetical protein D3C81_1789310 [compost metagenome]